MNANEIREAFLYYFSEKGHTVVRPSGPLVPEDDPTLLFTNAGMVQFKKVFLGTQSRPYKRAATCQKCMRAGGKHNDLENVGKTKRHHTFFEMLGNFSFGDYFKEGAIEFAWEFLTERLRLPKEKLFVTVFEEDDEAWELWRKKVSLPPERIKRMGEKDNFWSMGDVGPCGPCSEIIIDQGENTGCGRPSCDVGCDCDRFLELWNLVFMQYTRDQGGRLTALPKPSIDTGMGLERITAVLQGKPSNYDTDLFLPIIRKIEEISGMGYGKSPEADISIRVIADHSRAIAFLMSEGLTPSNEGRGYVLRRIIRRASRHGRFIGIKEPFLHKTVDTVIETMGGDVYAELRTSRDFILRATEGEEERFFETLEKGLGILEEELKALKKGKNRVIPGSLAFKLYDTYGFPVDLTGDIVGREGFSVDEDGFFKEMSTQRERARRSWKGAAEEAEKGKLYCALSDKGLRSEFTGYHSDVSSSKVVFILKEGAPVDKAGKGEKVEIVTEETPFYGSSGGQAGDTGVMVGKDMVVKVIDTKRPTPNLIIHECRVEEGEIKIGDNVELAPDMEKRAQTARNHTATHLLHAVLMETLGKHVHQSGSLVEPSGLRFDFNHFTSLTGEDIAGIEDKVNKIIRENIKVTTETLPYEKALAAGAMALFGEKYGDVVRMVEIKGVSRELCGGTHVKMTGDIGLVKVSSEGSIAAGIRRIEALTAEEALKMLNQSERILKESAGLLKVTAPEVPERLRKLLEYQKELEKEASEFKKTKKLDKAGTLLEKAKEIAGIKVLSLRVDVEDSEELRMTADALREKLKSGIIVLGAVFGEKALLLAAVTKDLAKKISAAEIIKLIAPIIGGKGGGKDDLAQAGGKQIEKMDEALREAATVIKTLAGRLKV